MKGPNILLVLVLLKSVFCEPYTPEYTVDFRSAYDQELYESVLDTEQCREQLNYLSSDTGMLFRFLDSSAKVPPGILSGNLNDLGDYFQCLSIDEEVNDMELQGKYCTVTVPLDQEIVIPPLIDLIPWPTIPSLPGLIPDIVGILFPEVTGVTWPDLSNITLPTFPDITLPPITLPDIPITLPNLTDISWPDLSGVTWPEGVTLPDLAGVTLPDLSNITLPDLSNITLPDLSNITLPNLSDVTLPNLSNFTLPNLSNISLPNLSEINWPTSVADTTLPDDNDLTWSRVTPPAYDGMEVRYDVNRYAELRKQNTMILKRYQALRQYSLGISGFGKPIESRVFPVVVLESMGGTFGLCIPKVCTTKEVIDHFGVNILNITYNDFFCRLPNDKKISPADIVAIVIFSIIGLCVIVSTSYDLHYTFVLKGDQARANTLLRCFSVYTNTRRFLTFNSPPGSLECVDGMRAISMMWVVIGHTYSFTLLGYIHNLTDAIMFLTKASTTWINSAPLTVDTFFMLSGILAVYTTVGKISRARFIRTIHLFYINRLLRMFPLLATVVLLQASLFNYVSDGPFWANVSTQAENCRKYWWAALLHVQNYVNPFEICIPQSWYLSVDVQLYYFCPIVMVWLFGKEKFAWIALASIVVVSLAVSTTYSFIYNFSAGLANPARLIEFNDYVTIYYINTLPRAAPFFVGMVYGYLLYLCKGKEVKIPKMYVALLWVIAVGMMVFSIFSMYPVMQIEHSAQMFDNFLNSYVRSIWACALGWMIFACVHGYGGPVNWFLSLQMWKLPARLSFAMYLVHVSIIMIANGSWVKTHFFSEGDNIYRFLSDLTITFVASFILCIAIDAPFSTLQKILMGGGAKKPRKPKSESQNDIIQNNEPTIVKTNL